MKNAETQKEEKEILVPTCTLIFAAAVYFIFYLFLAYFCAVFFAWTCAFFAVACETKSDAYIAGFIAASIYSIILWIYIFCTTPEIYIWRKVKKN